MGLWDTILKFLLRTRPQDLLGLLPDVDPARPLRLLDKEFPPPTPQARALDGFVEVGDDDPTGIVFHVEFEAEPRSDTGRRVFRHCALAHLGLEGRPIRPVMFYLWPGSEGRRPQRRYTWQAAGREVLRFDFETVCLWELGASELLARPAPGQWTLTPLCANAGPAEVARAIRQIVEAGGPAHTHHDLAAAAVTLAQRRFGAHDITHWLPRGILMDLAELEEFKALFPDVVERWERQARQTGLEAGREEGREEGREILRAVCASTVEAKLGAVAADVAKRLAALQDLALLRRLAVDLGAAQDREAVLAVLRRAGV